jgi:uncharacterized protein
MQTRPTLDRPTHGRWQFEGFVGNRLKAAVEGWLLPAPRANPAMLQIFRDRDRQPRRNLVPWAGEFVGKHLTASVLVGQVMRDRQLQRATERLVRDLIAVQDADGYLGPHPASERLVGRTAKGAPLWDVWGHYHCLLGLLLWHQATGNGEALAAARRAADLICRTFLDRDLPLTAAGAEEMNMAIIHAMCLLHQQTGEPRYLRMARCVESDWEIPPAGDYLRAGLAGTPFYQCRKPRWESLHDLLALPELYFLTGESRYRQAYESLWWSILEGDRHNTGGFTSGEQAVGNPYATGAIETCCTVAWIAMCIDMLRMTGDSRVADEIELATLNGAVGGQTPSGRWWTYNTPMDGVKLASAHEIVFQCHPGGPELNCCSVNAPRSLGMFAEWAVMGAPDGIALNYYGPCTLEAGLPSGQPLRLRQNTTYPRGGIVDLTVALEQPETFTLHLRVPQWSAATAVAVNGQPVDGASPGAYLPLRRTWANGDTLRLALDLSFHYWAGEREQAGKTSVYQGPILLAYDQRYNAMDPDAIPTLHAAGLTGRRVRWTAWPAPWLLLAFQAAEGHPLLLCDFASAGAAGTHYRSWLPITEVMPQPFSREHAVWTNRPGSTRR